MKKLLLFVIFSFLFSVSHTFSQGAWIQKANYGGAGRWLCAGFSIGNKGYIGTGLDWSLNMYNDFWEWDQSTNVWTQKANFGGTARYGAVGFSIGTKGYIGTGTDGGDYQDLWEYDPSTNIWTQKANFGGTARLGAVGFSIGTKGYIGTGYTYIGTTNDFWEWNQASNTWTQKANFGGTARWGAVGFSIGTKGYIGTGSDVPSFYKDFWEWDQASNTWTQKANFGGTARELSTGFSIGNKGYIGTGRDSIGGYFKDFWEWDQTANVWTQKMNVGSMEREGAVGFSIGAKGYIGTGFDYTTNAVDFWEFYQQTSLNLLTGKIFADTNSNCTMDIGEDSLVNWFVEAKSATNTLYGSTSSNGTYEVWVPTGTYTVSLIPKTYWQQICPAFPPVYTAVVAVQDTIANLDFGADISVYCPDLTVSIGSANMRRCLTNNFYVQYWNNGTTTAINPLLKINFDSKIIPLSCTTPWDSVSGTEYFWKVASVQPGQYVSFSLLDSISCNAQLGDTLFSYAQWLNVVGDCNYGNNIDYDYHIVIASFDPNAKEAYTTTNKVYIKQANILPTDTINYMIQFQNTGTDTAFTVVVYDTLDSDLNIPSVISGVSSHPYTFELMGTGILKWTFNNILLPDSNINEPASHGFVKFQILQKPNNINGTVIKNWAEIVFDFNTPVITDTVVLTVIVLSAIEEEKGKDFIVDIYPNPTDGIFTIQSTKNISSIEIVNVLGEKVYAVQRSVNQLSIDLSQQTDGIYFVRVQTEKGIVSKKVVVMR